MAHASAEVHTGAVARADSPAYQAYQILHVAFFLAPIVAGIDKFTHYLVDWDMYLSPMFARLAPMSPANLMRAVGGIEIIAALIVAFKPSIGGWIVGAWLLGIVMNLIALHGFYDIALRDFGLALGAFALARLSVAFE
jgi:hypothetical protein